VDRQEYLLNQILDFLSRKKLPPLSHHLAQFGCDFPQKTFVGAHIAGLCLLIWRQDVVPLFRELSAEEAMMWD
jgi:hypothetical protein